MATPTSMRGWRRSPRSTSRGSRRSWRAARARCTCCPASRRCSTPWRRATTWCLTRSEGDMNEGGLKGVVPDVAAARARVEAAGGALEYAGRLEDRRYDTPDRSLAARDHVLRVRIYRWPAGAKASIDFKGP